LQLCCTIQPATSVRSAVIPVAALLQLCCSSVALYSLPLACALL
jgi:hypothetical protein